MNLSWNSPYNTKRSVDSIQVCTVLSQTSFSLYLHNQWTYFHKLSYTGKPKIRAICTYVECTKAITNDWDIRPSVAIKALSANILWTAERIHMIELVLESAHQSVLYMMCPKAISIGRDTGISI